MHGAAITEVRFAVPISFITYQRSKGSVEASRLLLQIVTDQNWGRLFIFVLSGSASRADIDPDPDGLPSRDTIGWLTRQEHRF